MPKLIATTSAIKREVSIAFWKYHLKGIVRQCHTPKPISTAAATPACARTHRLSASNSASTASSVNSIADNEARCTAEATSGSR
eukprot:CAMPEP_0174751112 /NCGR_PEP_ID=MMETSP1094-20130205/99161_1 /TAXON_ID=156173 /ORGANISM="Chrysochromulina brevifilum, Strain UTEX LB 985" /LENGTH=83 /DNA_ID=CAMNT_0015956553 /DNA_START=257 /DNA_END=505 /DNA_ORIENTATION=+